MNNIKKTSQNKTVIIDCHGFIYRSYYVQPKMIDASGQEVGALYGFITMMIKILSKFNPKKILAVFDSGGKTQRVKIYKEYKTNRPKAPNELINQIPLIIELTNKLNIFTCSKYGVEADDIIASAVKKFSSPDNKIIIISSDKDLMQLVDNNVVVFDPVKNITIGIEEVKKKFGLSPERLKDYFSIVGDQADNIPGVKGIGDKGAFDLLKKFKDLDEIFNNIDNIEKRKKNLLKEGKKNAYISKLLFTLIDDIDLDFNLESIKWQIPLRKNLIDFLSKYEFKSLFNRLNVLYDMENLYQKAEIDNEKSNVEFIKCANQLSYLLQNSLKKGYISFYVEKAIYLRIYFSIEDNKCYVIYQENYFSSKETDKDKQNLIYIFLHHLLNTSIKKITYEIKSTLQLFSFNNVQGYLSSSKTDLLNFISSTEDILLMYYAIETKNAYNNDIRSIISDIFHDINTVNLVNLIPKFFNIFEKLQQKLFANKTLHIYKEFDANLVYVLHTMENKGILVDDIKIRSVIKYFSEKMQSIENEIFSICKMKFNLSSPQEISDIFFKKLKLSIPKQYNRSLINAKILKYLSEQGFKLSKLILDWQEYKKATQNCNKLLRYKNKNTNRIHSSFTHTKTVTSHISSLKPNISDILLKDKNTEVNSTFIVSKDYKIIYAQYTELELRILSYITNLSSIKESFKNNINPYCKIASEIFDVKIQDVTIEQSNQAKIIHFCIVNNICDLTLARYLNISVQGAKKYLECYMSKYKNIEKYIIKIENFIKNNNYINSIFYRKCSIKNTNNNFIQAHDDNINPNINYIIQINIADILKVVMICLDKELKRRSLDCAMILVINNAILFECKKTNVEESSFLIKNIMENAFSNFHLNIKIKFADNFSQIY